MSIKKKKITDWKGKKDRNVLERVIRASAAPTLSWTSFWSPTNEPHKWTYNKPQSWNITRGRVGWGLFYLEVQLRMQGALGSGVSEAGDLTKDSRALFQAVFCMDKDDKRVITKPLPLTPFVLSIWSTNFAAATTQWKPVPALVGSSFSWVPQILS